MSFVKNKFLIVCLGALLAISVGTLSVFAATQFLNNRVGANLKPTVYASIELKVFNGEGTFDASTGWVKVFDNYNKNVQSSNIKIVGDVLTLQTGAFSNIFVNPLDSSDCVYFRITNYTSGKTLNAEVTDSQNATIDSFRADGVELVDGIKYIGHGTSKYFYVNVNALYTSSNVDIPIQLTLSDSTARPDTVTLNHTNLTNTQLWFVGEEQPETETLTVGTNTDFSCILRPFTQHNLPATITMTINGVTAVEDTAYTYDNVSGDLKIFSEYIVGNIVITCVSA